MVSLEFTGSVLRCYKFHTCEHIDCFDLCVSIWGGGSLNQQLTVYSCDFVNGTFL